MLKVIFILWLQRNAGTPLETSETMDSWREKGRWLHSPSSGCSEQSRRSCWTAGTCWKSWPGFAKRQFADRVASRCRATAHANRSCMFISPPGKREFLASLIRYMLCTKRSGELFRCSNFFQKHEYLFEYLLISISSKNWNIFCFKWFFFYFIVNKK